MKKTGVVIVAVISMITLNGCGTLLSGPSIISMATSFFGGLANGAIFGGSVVGAIKSASDGASADQKGEEGVATEDAHAPAPNWLADSR